MTEGDQTTADDRATRAAPYRAIVESIDDGVVGIGGSGTVTFANAGMGAILGVDPADLDGRALSSFVPEGFSRYGTLVDFLSGGGSAPLDGALFDVPVVGSDGRRRWLSIALNELDTDGPTRLVGTVRDVTERHEREAELRRHEHIIETIDDGIYILDENFTITNVNEAVVSMTGYTRDELEGSHASLLATDELLSKAAEKSAELLESSKETATIVSSISTKSGEPIPIETRFSLYAFEDGRYGQLGVVRDISERKHYEETLTALNTSTRDLLAVDSKEAVSRLIIDTATEVLDLAGAIFYLFDPDGNVLRPVAASAGGADPIDALPALDPDGGVPWRVFAEEAAAALDGDQLGATGASLPFDEGLCVPLGEHGVFVAATTERRAVDDDTETLVELLAASAEEALSRLDREGVIRERDRTLELQNDRLRRLDRVNAIIRDVDQALVEAASTDEIGDAVCDRLVDSDRFAFAWFGEPSPADGTISPRSWSGDVAGYLDDVDLSIEDPREPAALASASGELTVVSDVGAERRGDRWRKAALSRNLRSALSVPLVHGDVTHGVLTVYSERPDAFADMEPVFTELGVTIANAINAVARERALLTNNHTQLGLRIEAADDVLQRFARRAGGPIEVEGVVPQSDDATRVYFVADPTNPGAFRSGEAASVIVEAVDVVAERDDRCLFEAVVTGPTVVTTVGDLGAQVGMVRVSAREISLDVELPKEADPRRFTEAIRERYPSAEVVSKTERERPPRTPTAFQYQFEDRLTERQMEVLRVAYLRGFFEWPRESTGQDVADALGVSQPTVNRHLRTCERKLFTLLFEGE